MGLGPNIASSLLDLSERGARLLLKAKVVVGQEVEIHLGGQSNAPVKQVAQVVWVVPAEGGHFCVGCNFQKSLPYAALSSLARL